jgi:hypothetical protein
MQIRNKKKLRGLGRKDEMKGFYMDQWPGVN